MPILLTVQVPSVEEYCSQLVVVDGFLLDKLCDLFSVLVAAALVALDTVGNGCPPKLLLYGSKSEQCKVDGVTVMREGHTHSLLVGKVSAVSGTAELGTLWRCSTWQ